MTGELIHEPPGQQWPEAKGKVVLWRREAWASTRLAVPLILAQLAHVAITTTDVLMMGWLGPEAVAAGSLGTHLYFPVFLLGLGVVAAVGPMTAQALGARQRGQIPDIFRQGLLISAVMGVVFGSVLWWGEAILLVFGQQAETAAAAQSYLRAALWGLAPSFALVVLRNFLAAHSRPRAIMVVMILGVCFNALADYALMFGHFGFPALGVVGAGLASSLVNGWMFLALLAVAVVHREFRPYRLLAGPWRPNLSLIREVLAIGIPIGLGILAESSLFAATALLMGLIGTTALAANAIALQCMSVAFMIPLGFSQAATVRVGLAAGAGDRAGLARAGWSALGLGLLLSALPVTLFLVVPRFLATLFLDPGQSVNLPVIETIVLLLGIAALFQVFDGIQIIAAGALRGLKDTRVPMWIALFGYWVVGFSCSLLLGFGLGLEVIGIWSGVALGLAVTAGLLVWRFYVLSARP
ncbi:MAG: MATE family efflux transporter [Pseudomonadota bacterium]